MTAIHFIERSDHTRKTDKLKNEWESGYWDIPEDVAQKLVGATLYLHRTKHQPSHFGGRILAYRIQQATTLGSCVVFTVRAAADCKNVRIGTKGWTKDYKILWDTPEPTQV
jgi:hypothetical protein